MSLTSQIQTESLIGFEDGAAVVELNRMMDFSDPSKGTTDHMKRVGRGAAMIGRSMSLSPEDVRTLFIAGSLHDIGKHYCGDLVASHEELSDSDKSRMHRHPIDGLVDIIFRKKSLDLPPTTVLEVGFLVVTHHMNYIDPRERYPAKVDLEDIMDDLGVPMEFMHDERLVNMSRIQSVYDSVDALTNSRAYHKKRFASEGLPENLSADHVASLVAGRLELPVGLNASDVEEIAQIAKTY